MPGKIGALERGGDTEHLAPGRLSVRYDRGPFGRQELLCTDGAFRPLLDLQGHFNCRVLRLALEGANVGFAANTKVIGQLLLADAPTLSVRRKVHDSGMVHPECTSGQGASTNPGSATLAAGVSKM